MEIEEFEKEHPSLKGHICHNRFEHLHLEVVHATQLDKKIVKMAIESNLPPSVGKEELIEELGLNTNL